ncbi:MAG: hypothetical protein K6D38_00505 [Pseudobutyrivibrio sp.]|nr:hypothetical protein [Pseudobutyrivibrio sp.]
MPRNEKSKKSNVLKSFSKVLKKVITGGGGSSKRPMQEIYNSDMSPNRIKKKLNEHNELPTPKRNQSLHQSNHAITNSGSALNRSQTAYNVGRSREPQNNALNRTRTVQNYGGNLQQQNGNLPERVPYSNPVVGDYFEKQTYARNDIQAGVNQSSREKTRLADNHSLDADYPFYEKPPTPDRSFSKVKTLRK